MARIFIGPRLKILTGQSYSFFVATKLAREDDLILTPSGEGDSIAKRIAGFMFAFLRYILILITAKCEVVYITTARSWPGFLRDAVFILTGRSVSRARIVNHLHGGDFRQFREGLDGWKKVLVDYVYRRVDCSIVLHEALKEQYGMYHNMSKEVVGSFVPEDVRSQRSFRWRDPAVPTHVVYLGNILHSKGVGELVGAAGVLERKGCKLRVTIAGPELQESFRSIVHRVVGAFVQVPKCVQRLPAQYGREKVEILKGADIFVLPSYGEGFPIAVLEAMSFGCAIVLSRVSHLEKIFEGLGVRFVKPGCVEDLAETLRELIERPEFCRELGTINYEATRDAYSEREYLANLERVLGERR